MVATDWLVYSIPRMTDKAVQVTLSQSHPKIHILINLELSRSSKSVATPSLLIPSAVDMQNNIRPRNVLIAGRDGMLNRTIYRCQGESTTATMNKDPMVVLYLLGLHTTRV